MHENTFIDLIHFIKQNRFLLVKDDIFFETIELSDGNYLSLGWTYSLGNGETDFFLVKTRPNGNILWTKTFGGYEKETGISVKEFSNGNLL